MTEKDFWLFLKGLWAKGREPMMAGAIDCDEPELQEAGKFIGGHSLLPKDYDKIPVDKIEEMNKLLLGGTASFPTKEAILILLAHHPSKEALSALRAYNAYPDKELKLFAQFALDECEMWNE